MLTEPFEWFGCDFGKCSGINARLDYLEVFSPLLHINIFSLKTHLKISVDLANNLTDYLKLQEHCRYFVLTRNVFLADS